MEIFPAVLIGGPPNSGKSILTANLTQALRERGVQHYVLRACPDGEGDWTHTADQKLVRTILVPQSWTPAFVQHICQDLERRHLPLIVDVGGKPKSWQWAIFDHCTHAIVLCPDETARAAWLERVARHALLLLADLRSSLHGESRLDERQPALRGVFADLEWGVRPQHALFGALVEQLAQLFARDAKHLRQEHLLAAPVETVIELKRLAHTLDVPFNGEKAIWQPDHLPAVLDYLPRAVSLGLYGRGPNWLYAALALLAAPAPFFQFDPRLGWVQARALRLGAAALHPLLQIQSDVFPDHVQIEGVLPSAYLDYAQLESLSAPPIPPGKGVLLSGRLPHWLCTSLALAYRAAPWVAVYQPQLGAAVIVYSTKADHRVGDCLTRLVRR